LATAIQIRDDEGQGLAADRTVRLKAIAAIEGKPDKAPLEINVHQTNNVATITPGISSAFWHASASD
jgi:hypothetical protein